MFRWFETRLNPYPLKSQVNLLKDSFLLLVLHRTAAPFW